MDNRPIGVFDSGLGGLSVVKEIIKVLPKEKIVYLGDTARVPYGSRSVETIARFALEDVNFLENRRVKAIVVACNTVSAVALKKLEKEFRTPIFGIIIPGARAAVKSTKNLKIGVIGTERTVYSQAYSKAIYNLEKRAKVYEKACPLFVPLIEKGEIEGPKITALAKKYLSFVKKNEIDTLVLGCTHYPIITNVIREIVGPNKKLINPAEQLSRDLRTRLVKNKTLASRKESGDRTFFVTKLKASFKNIANYYLGQGIEGKLKETTLEPYSKLSNIQNSFFSRQRSKLSN